MFKKVLAVIMAATMLLTFAPLSFASDAVATGTDAEKAGIDYTINNPYALVDFELANQYKADLHSHTTFSDGHESLPAMVERHYELGFDIMAISDHSTVSRGYTTQKHSKAMSVISFVKNDFKLVGDVLSDSGVASNNNSYNVYKENGDEFYVQTIAETGVQGQAMMRVPFANEQNGTSFNNAHVNTWFVDYGDALFGGTSNYIAPISNVDELGGLSVINHPGEYTNARDEGSKDAAYDLSDFSYNYKINKFANILNTYESCIGIDINSKGDYRTRYDRKLWDILLQKILPIGERNVFAIATTDAHNLGIVDSGYTIMLMKNLSAAALKQCMRNGEFFAASKYLGCPEEIAAFRATLTEIGTEEALNLIAKIDASTAEDGDGKFVATEEKTNAAAPKITNIVVDENADTITLTTENTVVTHWIADGKVIATGNTIDLDDYSDEIGKYVRAESLGEGGIIYTQAFVLDYEGAPTAEKDDSFFDWGTIASLICDLPVRFLIFLIQSPLSGLVKILADII